MCFIDWCLFELCLLRYLAQSQILGITLYISSMKYPKSKSHFMLKSRGTVWLLKNKIKGTTPIQARWVEKCPKKYRVQEAPLNPQGSRELKKGRDKMENISEINPNLFKKLICWKQWSWQILRRLQELSKLTCLWSFCHRIYWKLAKLFLLDVDPRIVVFPIFITFKIIRNILWKVRNLKR